MSGSLSWYAFARQRLATDATCKVYDRLPCFAGMAGVGTSDQGPQTVLELPSALHQDDEEREDLQRLVTALAALQDALARKRAALLGKRDKLEWKLSERKGDADRRRGVLDAEVLWWTHSWNARRQGCRRHGAALRRRLGRLASLPPPCRYQHSGSAGSPLCGSTGRTSSALSTAPSCES